MTEQTTTSTTPRATDETIEAWAGFVRVGQSLLGRVETDLKAAGFPPLAWYDALLELKRADRKGLRPFELQQEMLLAQYNLSRLVDRLAKAGHAKRIACDEDGRGHVVMITPSGRQLLRRMWPAYKAAIERHFACRLEASDARKLARLLDKLR